jgi:hypothetical protein
MSALRARAGVFIRIMCCTSGRADRRMAVA